jgi:hypothetical protein
MYVHKKTYLISSQSSEHHNVWQLLCLQVEEWLSRIRSE